nr:PREDICTED: leucine zipper protein 2 [Anolis carolinensis]|eukprot:XP_008114291.1 PREDICTED: leucine zipper protein 2 [Anolis carolinensis]
MVHQAPELSSAVTTILNAAHRDSMKTSYAAKWKQFTDFVAELNCISGWVKSTIRLAYHLAWKDPPSKKIQAQLKELRYGKKDLIFKAQQLTDLEQKLAIAKEELEKAALDKESQLKALKETVQLCLSSVLHNPPPSRNIISSRPIERQPSPVTNGSKVPFQATKQRAPADKETPEVSSQKADNSQITRDCVSQDVGKNCLGNQNNSTSPQLKVAATDSELQKSHSPPWIKPEIKKIAEKKENNPEALTKIKGKTL